MARRPHDIRLVGLRLVGLALALAAASLAPSSAGAQDTREQARQLFERGVAAMDGGNPALATQYFQQSYQLYQRASTACNMALALERSQRACDAGGWYRQCAALDTEGRFRDHAQRQAAALDAQCQTSPSAPNPFVGGPAAQQGSTQPALTASGHATVVEGPGATSSAPVFRTRGADHTLLAVGIVGMVLGGGAIGGGAAAAVEGQARLDGLPPTIQEGSPEHDRWLEAATLHDVALGLYIGGGALALLGAIMIVIDLAQPGAFGGSSEAAPHLRFGLSPTPGGAFGQLALTF